MLLQSWWYTAGCRKRAAKIDPAATWGFELDVRALQRSVSPFALSTRRERFAAIGQTVQKRFRAPGGIAQQR
jgi:hypothetical protein